VPFASATESRLLAADEICRDTGSDFTRALNTEKATSRRRSLIPMREFDTDALVAAQLHFFSRH